MDSETAQNLLSKPSWCFRRQVILWNLNFFQARSHVT